MSELLKLAERVEQATGPDRELDELIARSLNWCPGNIPASAWEKHQNAKPHYWFSDAFGMPDFTASLDAAMTLVPDGHGLLLTATSFERWAQIVSEEKLSDGSNITIGGPTAKAATPALALCAASLRALAAQEPSS